SFDFLRTTGLAPRYPSSVGNSIISLHSCYFTMTWRTFSNPFDFHYQFVIVDHSSQRKIRGADERPKRSIPVLEMVQLCMQARARPYVNFDILGRQAFSNVQTQCLTIFSRRTCNNLDIFGTSALQEGAEARHITKWLGQPIEVGRA